MTQLTDGAIADIMEGKEVENPVVQVLALKLVDGKGSADRYRMQISDGTHSYDLVTLSLKCHPLISQGHLVKFSVVRIDSMVIHKMQTKAVIIVSGLTVLKVEGEEVVSVIGKPVPYKPFAPDPTLSIIPFSMFADESAVEDHGQDTDVSTPQKKARYSTNVDTTVTSGHQSHETSSSSTQTNPTRGSSSSLQNNLVSSSATPTKPATIVPSTPKVAPKVGHNLPVKSTQIYLPIEGITPYSGPCSIHARVINKSEVRTWENATSSGQYFNIDILDDSGEIRMTGFGEQVDQHFNAINVNEVYVFSRFQIKRADKRFSSNNHDCELRFTSYTTILPSCDPGKVPIMPKMTFTKIIDILNLERDSPINVIGVCTRVGEVQKVTPSRTNKEVSKRDISLVDQSNTEVFVTLWAKEAENFTGDLNSVVLIRAAKVGDYCGKNLSKTSNEIMLINPDVTEAHEVREWYSKTGVKTEARCISGNMEEKVVNAPYKKLKELLNVDSFYRSIGYYFKTEVCVVDIEKENPLYKACPTPKCAKKLNEDQGTKMYCGKCKRTMTSFKWRMVLQVSFSDGDDIVTATCFNEEAEKVLLLTMTELEELYDLSQSIDFTNLIEQAKDRKFIATFRCKEEKINDEIKLHYTVVNLQPGC